MSKQFIRLIARYLARKSMDIEKLLYSYDEKYNMSRIEVVYKNGKKDLIII